MFILNSFLFYITCPHLKNIPKLKLYFISCPLLALSSHLHKHINYDLREMKRNVTFWTVYSFIIFNKYMSQSAVSVRSVDCNASLSFCPTEFKSQETNSTIFPLAKLFPYEENSKMYQKDSSRNSKVIPFFL